jgi:flagella basal body P-ring formation protein FlgA
MTLRHVTLIVAAAGILLSAVRGASGEVGPATRHGAALIAPAEAIERAVAQRVGGQVAVEVTSLETLVAPERALHATPEPGGRAGQPMRFVLMVGRARRGVAIATVKVIGSYARAARAIGRNGAISAADVEVVAGELPSVGIKRLPDAGAVIGLRARRDIAAGEPLTHAVLQLPPAVRPGDPVRLTVIAGAVQVTAKAIAAGSGHEGDTIRVAPQGGRPLKARITGPGAVEVVQ